jgi:hypothetical protein
MLYSFSPSLTETKYARPVRCASPSLSFNLIELRGITSRMFAACGSRATCRCAAASGASTSTTVAVKSARVDALAAQLTHKAAAATLPKPSPVEQSPVDPAGQSSSTSTKGQSKSHKKEPPRRENLLRASGARRSSPPRQQRDQRRRSPERRSSLRHASPEREASRRQRSPDTGSLTG